MLKKILLSLVCLLVVAVGYYFISPFFISVHLDEAVPVELISSSNDLPTGVTNSETKNKTIDQEVVSADPVIGETEEVSEMKKNLPSISPQTIIPAQVVASIVDTSGHKASGTVRIVKTATGDVVRFENFKTVNGPDLFVYLATDLEATEFIDLGRLKATEGNVNYSIPNGTNVEKYQYVMVWCKQFGVLFNYADISRL